ncbi:hypothetical protein WCLP8_1070004 [uncultured Gammaproteobacteria bacterium]
MYTCNMCWRRPSSYPVWSNVCPRTANSLNVFGFIGFMIVPRQQVIVSDPDRPLIGPYIGLPVPVVNQGRGRDFTIVSGPHQRWFPDRFNGGWSG